MYAFIYSISSISGSFIKVLLLLLLLKKSFRHWAHSPANTKSPEPIRHLNPEKPAADITLKVSFCLFYDHVMIVEQR